jgi:hypothetical protein
MAPDPLTEDMKKTFEAAEVLLKDAQREFKKAGPTFEKSANAYEKAVASKASPEELDILRDSLDACTSQVDKAMASTQGVLNYLKALRDSGATRLAGNRTTELLNGVRPLREQLTKFVERAQQLGTKGDKARDEAKNSVSELEGDLSAARARVKDVLSQVGGNPLEQGKKLNAAIDKAFDEKKQADVTKHRLALIELNAKKRLVESAKKEVEELMKRIPKDNADLRRGAQEQLDKVESALLDFPKIDEMMRKQAARGQVPVAKQEAEPPPKLNQAQVKKVAEIIGVASSDHAKLSKILEKQAHAKWPAEIAKACALKESDVKAKMTSVNKLEFIKPFYLIDI